MAKAKKSSTCSLQIRRCAAGGIMALSVLLVPAVLATRSSHVQTRVGRTGGLRTQDVHRFGQHGNREIAHTSRTPFPGTLATRSST
jgi:hypothetical protein